MKKEKNKNKGFTLIELLLYISISGIILFSISTFLYIILQSQVKNQVIANVEQEGEQVMEIITQSIRNAEGINSPTPGTNSICLNLDVIYFAYDPTIFYIDTSSIVVDEGGGPVGGEILITSSKIVASNLDFQNLSRSDTPGTVRIQFTLTHVNTENRNEYDYSKTFYGSASLRK